MRRAHWQTGHGGVQDMVSYIRTDFWIPRLRDECNRVIHNCPTCTRLRAEPAAQLMGDLPAIRVRPARPFYHCGVDYAGPYTLRRGPGRPAKRGKDGSIPTEKGYIAVFVCMVTRAVHLEPVTGMTSDAFIAALTRMIARRGFVAHMYSDNGTTFVGADREMREAVELWRQKKILDFVQSKGTEWHFITPAAPFQGGIWEAAVKQMKRHLRPMMGNHTYTFEEMSTTLAEIEAILNSRPLCAMSDDIDDMRALTPAHFLIGEELILPIPVLRDKPPHSLRTLHELRTGEMQKFWSRWSNEYLNTLQQRPKWKEERENVRIGQLAILKGDGSPAGHWALGRIIAVYPGDDGLVRNVTISIGGNHYDRPIQRLVIIPTDAETEYWR